MNKLNSQKIKKLNIQKDAWQAEHEIREKLPAGYHVVSQEFNVIQDKINQIIDHLNSQGVKREKKKGVK